LRKKGKMAWRENKDTVLNDQPYFRYLEGTQTDGAMNYLEYRNGITVPDRRRMPAYGDLTFVAPNVPVLRVDKGRPDANYEGGYYEMPFADKAREYAPFQRQAPELNFGKVARAERGLAAYQPTMTELGVACPKYKLTNPGIPNSGTTCYF
jgi:hypothetical protein